MEVNCHLTSGHLILLVVCRGHLPPGLWTHRYRVPNAWLVRCCWIAHRTQSPFQVTPYRESQKKSRKPVSHQPMFATLTDPVNSYQSPMLLRIFFPANLPLFVLLVFWILVLGYVQLIYSSRIYNYVVSNVSSVQHYVSVIFRKSRHFCRKLYCRRPVSKQLESCF